MSWQEEQEHTILESLGIGIEVPTGLKAVWSQGWPAHYRKNWTAKAYML
jgi:hypothetical protein